MIVTENILQKANKEIKRLQEEKNKWYKEFHLAQSHVNSLKKQLLNCRCEVTSCCSKVTTVTYDTRREEAMKRYTEKLKKENLKYAKQKQGQRQPPREISSKSSKGSRDQSSSSICK